MISCGYAERYRIEDLKKHYKQHWDVKPEMDEIVKWMQIYNYLKI